MYKIVATIKDEKQAEAYPFDTIKKQIDTYKFDTIEEAHEWLQRFGDIVPVVSHGQTVIDGTNGVKFEIVKI